MLVTRTVGYFDQASFVTRAIGQFDQTSFITRTIDGQNGQIQIPTKNRIRERSLARTTETFHTVFSKPGLFY